MLASAHFTFHKAQVSYGRCARHSGVAKFSALYLLCECIMTVDANGKLDRRSPVFWLATALAFVVAAMIFHRTKLVDHPEFVSFRKLLLAFGVWMALIAVAFWSSREKPVRFWAVFALMLTLVLPGVPELLRRLLG